MIAPARPSLAAMEAFTCCRAGEDLVEDPAALDRINGHWSPMPPS
jgi:hypothetical protein